MPKRRTLPPIIRSEEEQRDHDERERIRREELTARRTAQQRERRARRRQDDRDQVSHIAPQDPLPLAPRPPPITPPRTQASRSLGGGPVLQPPSNSGQNAHRPPPVDPTPHGTSNPHFTLTREAVTPTTPSSQDNRGPAASPSRPRVGAPIASPTRSPRRPNTIANQALLGVDLGTLTLDSAHLQPRRAPSTTSGDQRSLTLSSEDYALTPPPPLPRPDITATRIFNDTNVLPSDDADAFTTPQLSRNASPVAVNRNPNPSPQNAARLTDLSHLLHGNQGAILRHIGGPNVHTQATNPGNDSDIEYEEEEEQAAGGRSEESNLGAILRHTGGPNVHTQATNTGNDGDIEYDEEEESAPGRRAHATLTTGNLVSNSSERTAARGSRQQSGTFTQDSNNHVPHIFQCVCRCYQHCRLI